MGQILGINVPTHEPIKLKSNSKSSHAEQLEDYRKYSLDPYLTIMVDDRDDPLITWPHADYDPRFPNTDVSKWCYVSFVDYYRCRKLRGEDYEPCNFFQNVYQNVCPNSWIERWESWRENGTFLPNV